MDKRIVAFDIETTNLNANFGRILLTSFANIHTGEVVTMRGDDEKFRGEKLSDDSKLVAAIRDYMNDSFCWVSWNGKMFDVPFINTRLALADEETMDKRLHIDLMYYARKPFLKIHSSRLDAVAKTFELKEQKTELTPKDWTDAMVLDKEALDYIQEHCEQDVKVLVEVFPKLQAFIANIHK